MKQTTAILGSLIFASLILVSCNTQSHDKKADASIEHKTNTEASKDNSPAQVNTELSSSTIDKKADILLGNKTNSEASKDNSPSEATTKLSSIALAIVKAKSTGNKYVDWGSRPTESEDGPVDPWTWTHMMCSGPPCLDNIKASSTLVPQRKKKKYSVDNICDDDPTTAWVEGKEDHGIGEFFEMKWVPMGSGEITLLNGYQASKSTWENNSRVKKMKVSIGGKDLCVVALADVMGRQQFTIPGHSGPDSNVDVPLRFTILEVYPGLKWKDTAISGIFSCGG